MPTALVVDDSRQAADCLCRMLDMLGVESQPAYGPRAAILWLNQLTPDIIFMDIHMSGVDGFEVLAYLRRLPRLANIPVVFISSDDQPETIRRAVREGALGLIPKPATLSALEKTLIGARLIM